MSPHDREHFEHVLFQPTAVPAPDTGSCDLRLVAPAPSSCDAESERRPDGAAGMA